MTIERPRAVYIMGQATRGLLAEIKSHGIDCPDGIVALEIAIEYCKPVTTGNAYREQLVRVITALNEAEKAFVATQPLSVLEWLIPSLNRIVLGSFKPELVH